MRRSGKLASLKSHVHDPYADISTDLVCGQTSRIRRANPPPRLARPGHSVLPSTFHVPQACHSSQSIVPTSSKVPSSASPPFAPSSYLHSNVRPDHTPLHHPPQRPPVLCLLIHVQKACSSSWAHPHASTTFSLAHPPPLAPPLFALPPGGPTPRPSHQSTFSATGPPLPPPPSSPTCTSGSQ